MKLVRCEWAPSLVVEWLCGELEERGIPGPTYAHTLLSLLHHHYCPHPAPTTPISAPTCSALGAADTNYQHPLSSRHLDDFDLRDLDLDDLLGHTTHPDADLPDFTSFSSQQRGGSRRARKRYKVRQKQRILTSEQLQKVAALQCLMSASDERYDLESLVEELCARLKTAAENELNVTNNTTTCNKKSVARKGGSQESINDTDDSASTSTPEEQAEKYYAAFPPLSKSCKDNCIKDKQWKPGKAACPCVREEPKPTFAPSRETFKIGSSSSKMPRSHRKKGREKEKKKDPQAKLETADGHDGSRRHHHVAFTWHAAAKHREKLSESYDTDSASEPERSGERRRKKFLGPLLDEDIGEGYIGDTSSRESSEDRDKGELDLEKSKVDKADKSYGLKGRKSQEEWECMGDLLLETNRCECSFLPETGGGGGRLFERGSTSGGTSGSSSDVETFPYLAADQDAESVRQLERKISDTVAQVWGQASEHLGHGQGEHVWDPPSMEELTFYTTVWGFGFPEQQHDTQDLPAIQQTPSNEIVHPTLISNIEGWQENHSWQALDLITQNDPLLCNISCQSPQENNNEEDAKDASALVHLNSSLEKSIWSDCNANNISGSEGTISACLEDSQLNNILDSHKNENCQSTDDLENKLCESFMKLGLENLWENTLGLEGVFADSISNNNLEYISENNSCQGEGQTDSEHEKMMALVEDVCKSYESQEESAVDSSLLKQLPLGPMGPQADLHHTESSGFSMVVPRGKSAESLTSHELIPESMLLGHSHANNLGSMDTLPHAVQEDENLLTSPRTHFRPIRQESIGSTADDHYEDGTMFIINSERPDLPFQRTSSGALFLESDLLEGSPKKYMVYKEPVPKVAPPDDEEEVLTHDPYPAVALVPKFKVVNNEKFCQTEAAATPSGRASIIGEEKCMPYEAVGRKEHFAHNDDDKEPDVFEFQHQDFPDTNNLAHIWKSKVRTSEIAFPRNIWHINSNADGDGWPHLSELERAGLSGSAWFAREGEGAMGWSSEGQFEPPPEVIHSQRSEALASLWHRNSPSATPSFPGSIPNLQTLWADTSPQAIENSDPDTGRSKMYVITNPTTHIPENCSVKSSLAEASPWKPTGASSMESSGKNRHDHVWTEKSVLGQHRHLIQDVRFSQRSGDVSTSSNVDIPGVCPELRLEVDQEADELLGAVHAQTTNSLSHCQTHLPSGHHPLLPDHHSPRPLHERLKKSSSGNPVSKTTPSSVNPDYKFKGVQELEREDLDDLAPGWELNDGFEWEPQNSGDPEDEECPDGLVDDEDGESGEILLYETEDGTTYTIPVEYLDNTLYDQIFGATDSAMERLGGSLPDLPSGHPAAIHFSTQLEDEWKKSGIPYKVQLPRKPRPGRWIPPSRRPCTFFMEGSCRRSDCKFSHDLASITCRFWEEGSCLKGITCPFLHGYPLRRRRRNKSDGAAPSEGDKAEHHSSSFEIDSEMDFPTLGSSCDSKTGCADERSQVASSIGSSSSQNVTRKKKRKFITITKNVLGEVKSAEAERALRRRAALRRERRRRHTDTTSASTNLHAAVSNSEETPALQHNPHTRRKAERHRASASGHDDGTVSDY